MRSSILAAAALAFVLLRPGLAAPVAAVDNCGIDRPEVQTLTDPNAGDVDTGQLIGVNLSTLAALPVPEGIASGTRYNPYETTLWATVGELVSAKLDATGSIVLTLRDPDTDDTIQALFPDAARCAASADPSMLQFMEEARGKFVQAYGTPALDGVLPLSGEAEVAGVGFIPSNSAPAQGGTGSGIEISPVLAFAPLSSAVPSPSATPTPAPSTPATPTAAAPSPTSTPAAGG